MTEEEKAKKAIGNLTAFTIAGPGTMAYKDDIEDMEKILNYIDKLENRYLELIINGKPFKIKNDVKKLQYTDYENKEFTLEVLEKWN